MNKGKNLSTGIGLIAFGLFFFAGQYLDNFGLLFLPAMGLGFIVWSLVSRNIGLLIPGGILSGIGLGTVLMESRWITRLELVDDGGVFLVSFALGWFLITLLSIVAFQKPMLWPMIPGGILGFIGLSQLINEGWLDIFSGIGNFWPLILVAVGAYILWKNFREEDKLDDDVDMMGDKEKQFNNF